MDEHSSKSYNSKESSTITSWGNKVLNHKMQASFSSNMAACSPQARKKQMMEKVKEIARELAKDIVHHVAGDRTPHFVNSHVRIMRRTVDELRARHELMFNSMVSKLEITKESGFHQSFKSVADEMFSDKRYNWGRVVSVYAFGGRLAKYCVDKNMHFFVEEIGEFLGDYVVEHLSGWIHKQGGWEAFDEYFPDLNGFEDKIWKGLLFTAFGLGAIATMVAVR